jgi:hypothetical protein
LRRVPSIGNLMLPMEDRAPNPIAALHDVIEVVLLFHAGGQWTLERRVRWEMLTGREATSKSMCDWLREIRATLPPREVQ